MRKGIARSKARIIFFLSATLFWAGAGIAGEYEARGLLPGEGRDLVLENCTGCHSTAIILQNNMSRERWNDTITWMQEKQGLRKLSPEVLEGILAYLEKTQGPRKPTMDNRPARKIYQFEYQPNPL